MRRKFRLDRAKFKALAAYLVERAGTTQLSASEIYTVLWLADARMFMLHGRPISGATYVREGADLSVKGGAAILAGLEQADASAATLLSDEEREIADWALTSAADPQWRRILDLAAVGETIPYTAILAASGRPPTDEELEWARHRASELIGP